MRKNLKSRKSLILTALISATLVSGATQAEHKDSAAGYLKDSWGDIVRTGSGECMHTGNWTAEMATIIGCDGATLDQSSTLTKGQGTGINHQVHIPVAVLFDFDSAELTADGKEALLYYRDQITPEMAEIYGGVILGHTDSQGSQAYNQDLSERRAQSIQEFLINLGAPAEKIHTKGKGQEYPIASNDDEMGQQLNRRAEVAIAGELRADDTMELPSAALFSAKSSDLSKESIAKIKAYGDEIKSTLTRISKIEIVGHSDNALSSEEEMLIAQQRAETVRDMLVEKGLPADMIEIRIEGSQQPVASNRTTEGRAENRRVDIHLSGRAV
ncbi:MAG: OmpA family protein [Motiliproteus sp.]|nr:OmpA family protein [Motiliproteus sp.]MCW9052838.1 OmpA family protein [Motiliproteus sp.]